MSIYLCMHMHILVSEATKVELVFAQRISFIASLSSRIHSIAVIARYLSTARDRADKRKNWYSTRLCAWLRTKEEMLSKRCVLEAKERVPLGSDFVASKICPPRALKTNTCFSSESSNIRFIHCFTGMLILRGSLRIYLLQEQSESVLILLRQAASYRNVAVLNNVRFCGQAK